MRVEVFDELRFECLRARRREMTSNESSVDRALESVKNDRIWLHRLSWLVAIGFLLIVGLLAWFLLVRPAVLDNWGEVMPSPAMTTEARTEKVSVPKFMVKDLGWLEVVEDLGPVKEGSSFMVYRFMVNGSTDQRERSALRTVIVDLWTEFDNLGPRIQVAHLKDGKTMIHVYALEPDDAVSIFDALEFYVDKGPFSGDLAYELWQHVQAKKK